MIDDYAEGYETTLLTAGLVMEFDAAMEREGVTQQEVAERLGVTQSRVSQILARENMTLETAARFALALGLRIEFKLVKSEVPR